MCKFTATRTTRRITNVYPLFSWALVTIWIWRNVDLDCFVLLHWAFLLPCLQYRRNPNYFAWRRTKEIIPLQASMPQLHIPKINHDVHFELLDDTRNVPSDSISKQGYVLTFQKKWKCKAKYTDSGAQFLLNSNSMLMSLEATEESYLCHSGFC